MMVMRSGGGVEERWLTYEYMVSSSENFHSRKKKMSHVM